MPACLLRTTSTARVLTKASGVVEVTNTASNEILQENHYYPFGLNMSGPWMNDAALDNRYQYNGKELNDDFGLGWNDYGARWYDASVGRWWVVDSLAPHPNQIDKSPYAYAWGNPVKLTDPDGNCPSCIIGGLIGAAVEYGGQVIANRIDGKSWKESLTDIHVADVGIAAGEGFITNGASVARRTGVKLAIGVAAEVAENTLDVKGNESGGFDVTVNSAESIAKNTAIGLVAGKVGDSVPSKKAKIFNSQTPKQAVKEARKSGQRVNRATRLEIENKAKKMQKEAKKANEEVGGFKNKVAAEAGGEVTKRRTE
jgi:RHS repeat-associated protein